MYILDYRLQNSQKIPRWKLRSRLEIFVGNLPLYSENIALVYDTFTELVLLQYHLIFDNDFSMLSSI